MLWAMFGTMVALWAVIAVPFALVALLRRRKARRARGSAAGLRRRS